MDNLSHSLIGLAVGELVQRSLARERDPGAQRQRRRLLLVAALVSSNFPDLDLLLTPLLPQPLGYLMHHRGHTHTLLWLLPQLLLLWAAIWCWPSARSLLRTSVAARVGLVVVSALGMLLHLGMDFLNSYGLHPFHPIDSRWFYGDAIFILEPVFWVLPVLPLVMSIQRLRVRALLLVSVLALPIGLAANGFLAWTAVIVLELAALAVAGVSYHNVRAQRRPTTSKSGLVQRRGLLLAFGLCLAFVAVQGLASRAARGQVVAAFDDGTDTNRVIDAAMTPFPTHPLCWVFVSVETGAERYRIRRGMLSLWPAVFPVSSCPARLAQRSQMGAPGVAGPGGAAAMSVSFDREFSLAALRAYRAQSCHFDTWLRFVRMPSLDERSASDERYGPLGRANFTSFVRADFAGEPCPEGVPQWAHPRADLLGL